MCLNKVPLTYGGPRGPQATLYEGGYSKLKFPLDQTTKTLAPFRVSRCQDFHIVSSFSKKNILRRILVISPLFYYMAHCKRHREDFVIFSLSLKVIVRSSRLVEYKVGLCHTTFCLQSCCCCCCFVVVVLV